MGVLAPGSAHTGPSARPPISRNSSWGEKSSSRNIVFTMLLVLQRGLSGCVTLRIESLPDILTFISFEIVTVLGFLGDGSRQANLLVG